MVRWLVMCARGVLAVHRYLVITMFVDAVGRQCERRATADRAATDDQDEVLVLLTVLAPNDAEANARPRRVERPSAGRDARRVVGEIDDEAVLHPEHGVGVQVRVVGDGDVRDERAVPGRLDPEVQVRRAHSAPAGGGEQVADRAVVGDRVGRRAHRPEPVGAVRPGVQPPSPA